jgi:drug/metabolite transporter (DMT)-like permease
VARVTSLAFVTPFLSLVVLYFVLGEVIMLSTVLGITLIIAGLLAQKFFSGDN